MFLLWNLIKFPIINCKNNGENQRKNKLITIKIKNNNRDPFISTEDLLNFVAEYNRIIDIVNIHKSIQSLNDLIQLIEVYYAKLAESNYYELYIKLDEFYKALLTIKEKNHKSDQKIAELYELPLVKIEIIDKQPKEQNKIKQRQMIHKKKNNAYSDDEINNDLNNTDDENEEDYDEYNH
jgi:hypothetical protein